MIQALVYLHLTSVWNALLAKFRRLKQPRYLAGFVVGLAYFYFFVFRHLFRASARASVEIPQGVGALPDWHRLVEPALAFALFVIVLLAWILPRSRDVLRFTEAEISFLFTAPIKRSTLIHYKLVKSQLGILIASVLFGLFSRSLQALSGPFWVHTLGYWLAFSTLNLHFIASSFMHERLLGLGVRGWLRKAVAAGLLVLACAGSALWMRHSLSAQSASSDFVEFLAGFFAAPPLSWLLYPCQLLVRPFLAKSAWDFVAAAGPAFLLLGAHYLWVIKSQISFEEASLEFAQKRTARLANFRKTGRLSAPKKSRKEPFVLSPRGHGYPAFFWRGMITAGQATYPAVWLAAGAVVCAAMLYLRWDASFRGFASAVSIFCAIAAGWLLLMGPMLTRRGTQQLLERLDIVKSYPVAGWQVVFGELLTPLFILSAFEWLLLLGVGLGGAPKHSPEIVRLLFGPGALGLALLAPPLLGLMLSISFAALLYFPAWVNSMSNAKNGGIELMGMRVLFTFGYMITFVVAILPAVLLGSIPYIAIYLLTDSHLPAMLAAALFGALVLAAELGLVVWWLGARYEKLDLSVELPR